MIFFVYLSFKHVDVKWMSRRFRAQLAGSETGPEIVDFGDLNGSLLPQNSLEKVGGFANHLFQSVFRSEGAV